MRVRFLTFAALTLLLAMPLSAGVVDFTATGTFEGKPVSFHREGDSFFFEAFTLSTDLGLEYDLALNFGSNQGGDKFRWELEFMAPEGLEIKPGTYSNPSRDTFARGAFAYMKILAGGADVFHCNGDEPTAGRTFTISSLDSIQETGQVNSFVATFSEKCGDNTLNGTVRYGRTALPTGDGDGGDDGGGTSTGPPPVPFQIQLPSDFDTQPLVLTNSGAQTVNFKTAVDLSTFNNDLHLAVVTDATDTEDFHATVTPSTIAAPGNGDAKLTITTGPMTFPRVYQVMLTATAAEQVFSRTFLVHVMCDPPTILGINQPKSVTAANGSQVTLEVKPTGSGPFFYQWYKGFPGMTRNPVLAANESKLIFTTRESATYWVRVSNACGSVDSNPVTVTTTGTLVGPARRRS
ncbi:MAG TPA: immunoglobulin domain-containing protein [Thermoanaerobaculia bacterium]|nr:immunoglobulin domain-containing protein [Thermoanaerobaculia bacterium]